VRTREIYMYMLSTRCACGPWRTLKVVRGWLRVLWHTKFLSYYSRNILYFRMGLRVYCTVCICIYTSYSIFARERERKTTAARVKNTTTTVTTATTMVKGIERVESLRGKLCARENRINNNY